VEIGFELGEEIVEFLASRVASHKRLRGGVRFVDEIPKSAAGKILRRILKEKYQHNSEVGTGKDKQGSGASVLVEQDESNRTLKL
jgi:4-coumarate--CoA ligase